MLHHYVRTINLPSVCHYINFHKFSGGNDNSSSEKVYFRSQILERPSIGEYWNISGVPVLPENVIFMFFRTAWCYSEAYNTGMQKWSSIVQYSCTSIWDLKYTFSSSSMLFVGVYVQEQYHAYILFLEYNYLALKNH